MFLKKCIRQQPVRLLPLINHFNHDHSTLHVHSLVIPDGSFSVPTIHDNSLATLLSCFISNWISNFVSIVSYWTCGMVGHRTHHDRRGIRKPVLVRAAGGWQQAEPSWQIVVA